MALALWLLLGAVVAIAVALYRTLKPALTRGTKLSIRLAACDGHRTARALVRAILSHTTMDGLDLSFVPAERLPLVRKLVQFNAIDDAFMTRWFAILDGLVCEEHLIAQLAVVLTLLGTRIGSLLLTKNGAGRRAQLSLAHDANVLLHAATPVASRPIVDVAALVAQWSVGPKTLVVSLAPPLIITTVRTLLQSHADHCRAVEYEPRKTGLAADMPSPQLPLSEALAVSPCRAAHGSPQRT